MSAEVDMKDVELNEVELEKQPMTSAETGNGDAVSPTSPEKNGIVKLKIPDDGEPRFNGLSKEELMKVAGTPGWVRTRWALLILFWLGWIGMLAGAIAIIIQAPRCKPMPETNWWNQGPLYQIGDVKAFTASGNLKGLQGKLGLLNQLNVKGLVIGPLHEAAANDQKKLEFTKITSDAGNNEEFKELIQAAHLKGISVVLDLTPNYQGQEPWFTSIPDVAEKLKSALVYWQGIGVDGFLFSGVERVSAVVPSLWNDIKVIVNGTEENAKKRVLIGVTSKTSPVEVGNLLNISGVDLLLSGVLRPSNKSDKASAIQHLYDTQDVTKLAWNIGDRVHGHLASLVGSSMVKLNQLLLLTLPGTPVFNYGDEIGLDDEESTKLPIMVWDANDSLNGTLEAERMERISNRDFFKSVSNRRVKELSLMYGEYVPLFNSSSALAFLRRWDQSERYLSAFNWGQTNISLPLGQKGLPEKASVVVSTDESLEAGSSVDLSALKLNSGQAVLLKFPYTG
ncbi:solute carrier family 3 member 2b [Denticeps clupeoides]|uniref:Glycosyl hydrolase family 13 catalytic domain-containing protein n=1 Tax=Denticeps clupeoides TaxID=299321 RepID=A0AAY4ADT0_9TELE|nr:4F2 cell-surface antigen heavy chain [Denticeps clupeoides]